MRVEIFISADFMGAVTVIISALKIEQVEVVLKRLDMMTKVG